MLTRFAFGSSRIHEHWFPARTYRLPPRVGALTASVALICLSARALAGDPNGCASKPVECPGHLTIGITMNCPYGLAG
jgi:hypothetical protein